MRKFFKSVLTKVDITECYSETTISLVGLSQAPQIVDRKVRQDVVYVKIRERKVFALNFRQTKITCSC